MENIFLQNVWIPPKLRHAFHSPKLGIPFDLDDRFQPRRVPLHLGHAFIWRGGVPLIWGGLPIGCAKRVTNWVYWVCEDSSLSANVLFPFCARNRFGGWWRIQKHEMFENSHPKRLRRPETFWDGQSRPESSLLLPQGKKNWKRPFFIPDLWIARGYFASVVDGSLLFWLPWTFKAKRSQCPRNPFAFGKRERKPVVVDDFSGTDSWISWGKITP